MHFSNNIQLALALAGAAQAKNIIVQVSDQNAGLKYNPSTIQADIGDTVEFIFNPKNHTVTESSFAQPCVPLASGPGFNSGFNPVAAGAAEQPTFTFTVADNNPHWFYCAQAKHCEMGMTGVINPPKAKPENNAESFAALAAKVNATIAAPNVQGGTVGKIAANGASNGTTTAGTATTTASHAGAQTGTAYTTAWTYTSNGNVYTKATTENVVSWSTTAYTSAWTYTSNGQAIATQTVGVASVPVVATAAADKVLAGAGMAGAAAAAAAAMIF